MKKDIWLNDVIEKGKVIILELAKDTFVRYRQLGQLILNSGYKKGSWHDAERNKVMKCWNISSKTFDRFIQLGEMTDVEFRHAVTNFKSFHNWANQQKSLLEQLSIEKIESSNLDDLYSLMLFDYRGFTSILSQLPHIVRYNYFNDIFNVYDVLDVDNVVNVDNLLGTVTECRVNDKFKDRNKQNLDRLKSGLNKSSTLNKSCLVANYPSNHHLGDGICGGF